MGITGLFVAMTCLVGAADAGLSSRAGPWGLVVHTPFHAEALHDLGVQWVRVSVRWNETEVDFGKYDWKAVEAVLNYDLQHGFHVIATLTAESAPPGYALDAEAFPRLVDGLAAWAGAAGKRFAGRGILWELGNEPEVFPLGGVWSRPENYAVAALREAAALHTTDPRSSIAALSVGWMDRDYIERALEAGLLRSGDIDVVAYHGYHRPRMVAESGLADDLAWLRRTIARHAPPGKLIRVIDSERGYALDPSGRPKDWGNWRNEVHSESEQAALLARHYLESIADGVELVVWYKDMFGEQGFSLFYADEHDPRGLRPMGYVYRNLARLLPEPPESELNDRYEATLLDEHHDNSDPNTLYLVRTYVTHRAGAEQLLVALWNPEEIVDGQVLSSRRREGDQIVEDWRAIVADDHATPQLRVAFYGLAPQAVVRVRSINLLGRSPSDTARPLPVSWRGKALVTSPVAVGSLPTILVVDLLGREPRMSGFELDDGEVLPPDAVGPSFRRRQ